MKKPVPVSYQDKSKRITDADIWRAILARWEREREQKEKAQ